MVHTRAKTGEDVCLPQELGRHAISPCLFFYSTTHGPFLPLEYEAHPITTPLRIPSKAFLSDLVEFLRGHGLDQVLGLSRVSPSEEPWIERLLPDGRGTVAVQSQEGAQISGGVVTEWAFVLIDGNVYFRTLR